MTKVRNSLLLINRQVDQARDFELKSLFEHLYYNYKVKLIFNSIVSSKFLIYFRILIIKQNLYDNTNVITYVIFYP